MPRTSTESTRRDSQVADVCVLGLGHVGFPLAVLAASTYDVVGVDVDESRIATIEAGAFEDAEPALRERFDDVQDALTVQTTIAPADRYVIATPTPITDDDTADLAAVEAACEMIATELTPGDLVVLTSTVPPGTTERLLHRSSRDSGVPPDEIALVYCPERALPTDTVAEMTGNDRLVGAIDDRSATEARRFYESFVDGSLHVTDPRTAEFAKLVENTYRDVNIALANEFALLAETHGVDVHEAIALANDHPRVDVHRPGPGVGGHCIPIDPWFLLEETTQDTLISQARARNDEMATHVYRHIQTALPDPTSATVTVFGAAYKGGVGDTRMSPARLVVDRMQDTGWTVRVHDPCVEPDAFDPAPVDRETALTGSDCLVILTDHDDFTDLDPTTVGDRMANRAVVDARALVDPAAWQEAGFSVRVLGDGTTT